VLRRYSTLVLLLGFLLSACGSSDSDSSPATSTTSNGKSALACDDLETLRASREDLSVATNPRTGNAIEYAVIGDGAASDELIVMFNGTGGIFPDWPVQMITNSAYSPKISGTTAYNPDEDGEVSLCHDYRLVLFDYPGVGNSQSSDEVTFDQIADDVDAMLEGISDRYGLSTDQVNLVGWSLGTLAASKFAFLSAEGRPDRTIRDAVLIATKPGGAVDGVADGHQAECAANLFEHLKDPNLDLTLKIRIETALYKLTFPYQKQSPYDGLDSGCTATVDTSARSVSLNVTPHECSPESQCGKMLADYLDNRATSPWSETHGVPQEIYDQQRELVHDWNYCYCATAGRDFDSTDCSCSETSQMSDGNGGVCQCEASNVPYAPECSGSVPLNLQDELNVLNGREDLYIQWTYGREFVEAYQRDYGQDKATLATYEGADGAGHGVLLQHPGWVQEQIHTALQND
jgi:pimeloyl-ACP methyl ester carboxylesterase